MMSLKLVLVMACILTATFDPIKGSVDKAALIIIDMQDCFVSGGSLAVSGGNDIIPVINDIRNKYKNELSLVVVSKDWHPLGHVSFASSHPDAKSPLNLKYTSKGELCQSPNISVERFPDAQVCDGLSDTKTLQQALWPDHCVQGVTSGPTSAGLAPGLEVEGDDLIIKKGTNLEIDSYSAFFDNGGFGKTKLDVELKARGITHVFVTGLAADYCVYFTSLDAQKLGYETYYVTDAVKSVSKDTYQQAIQELTKKGVHTITAEMIPDVLSSMNENNSSPGLRKLSLTLIATFVMTSLVNRLV